MTLQEAWLELIDMENYENISPSQIYSILSDFGVFKENPKLRIITKSALEYGLWQLVIGNKKNYEVHLFKSKLLNDGFDKDLIDIIIFSFQLQKETNIKSNIVESDKEEVKSNSNNSIHILGISLGSNINEFIQVFVHRGFQKIGRKTRHHEIFVEFTGKFIGISNCIIKLFYGDLNNNVYRIEIESNSCSDTEYLEIENLYLEKYKNINGVTKFENKINLQHIIIFNFNNQAEIKLRRNAYFKFQIEYIDLILYDNERLNIDTKRKKEREYIIKAKERQKNQKLSDI